MPALLSRSLAKSSAERDTRPPMSSSSIRAARSQHLLEFLAQVPDPAEETRPPSPPGRPVRCRHRGGDRGVAVVRRDRALGRRRRAGGADGLGAARGPAEESTFRRAFALVSPDVLDRLLGACHPCCPRGRPLWHNRALFSARSGRRCWLACQIRSRGPQWRSWSRMRDRNRRPALPIDLELTSYLRPGLSLLAAKQSGFLTTPVELGLCTLIIVQPRCSVCSELRGTLRPRCYSGGL